jgi:hypothetical protein
MTSIAPLANQKSVAWVVSCLCIPYHVSIDQGYLVLPVRIELTTSLSLTKGVPGIDIVCFFVLDGDSQPILKRASILASEGAPLPFDAQMSALGQKRTSRSRTAIYFERAFTGSLTFSTLAISTLRT